MSMDDLLDLQRKAEQLDDQQQAALRLHTLALLLADGKLSVAEFDEEIAGVRTQAYPGKAALRINAA